MKEYEFPWVTFRLADRLFGIESSFVMEMLVLPAMSQLPATADYMRGVMNLRDNVILVVDLRRKMRMPSASQHVDELVELLAHREEDHHKWVNELEASVKENREFKLTTDPHACAFGKWYDTYKPTNLILENHLKKFDEPHKRIHALGTEVIMLMKAKKGDEAATRIEYERSRTLTQLTTLFAEAKNILRETLREIIIVLNNGERTVGVTVDTIESVEYLKEGTIDEIPGLSSQLKDGLVTHTGKTARGEKIVLLMNVDEIFSDAHAAADLGQVTAAAAGG